MSTNPSPDFRGEANPAAAGDNAFDIGGGQPIDGVGPLVRSKSDPKLIPHLFRDAAAAEIVGCQSIVVGRRLGQIVLVDRRDRFQGGIQRFAVVRIAGIGLGTGLILFDFDSGTRRQLTQRGGKIDAVALHDEAEDVTADVANPALPSSPFGVDRHRWTAVVVPRALGDKVSALWSQLGS